MLLQPKHYFEAMLGIAAPWSIQDVALDEKNNLINIELAYEREKKSKFSFFSRASDSSQDLVLDLTTKKQWVHTSFGYYACHISASVCYKSDTVNGIGRDQLLMPAFIGDVNRRYTNQLRQQIALASLRGLSPDAISHSLNVEQSVVDEALTDIDRMPDSYRQAAALPTETDPIWGKIITDKVLLKTQVFSLKLLLSKLKLSYFDTQNGDGIASSVNELRKFFIAQISGVQAEFNQICSLTPARAAEVKAAAPGAMKLVLPSLKNGIWLKIVSGKVNLHSANIPLNLMVSRIRLAFRSSEDSHAQLVALNTLREFFKKNAKQLKPELILINKLMNAPEEVQYSLPDERHEIWKRILRDDTVIPSAHIAYKLLLANLRSQVLMNPDPVVELNAARRIRDFIKQNQRFMQQEYRMVLNSSYA